MWIKEGIKVLVLIALHILLHNMEANTARVMAEWWQRMTVMIAATTIVSRTHYGRKTVTDAIALAEHWARKQVVKGAFVVISVISSATSILGGSPEYHPKSTRKRKARVSQTAQRTVAGGIQLARTAWSRAWQATPGAEYVGAKWAKWWLEKVPRKSRARTRWASSQGQQRSRLSRCRAIRFTTEKGTEQYRTARYRKILKKSKRQGIRPAVP